MSSKDIDFKRVDKPFNIKSSFLEDFIGKKINKDISPDELLRKYLNDEMHSEFELKNDDLKAIEYKIKNKFINYDHLLDTKSSNEKKQNNRFDLTKVNLDILPNYILNNLEKYKSWID